LLAEALWREGSDADALARVSEALTLAETPVDQRPLRVLEADILFASGKEEAACALYLAAMAVSSSAWVDAQMERCGTTATAVETP
jgi:alanine racemase